MAVQTTQITYGHFSKLIIILSHFSRRIRFPIFRFVLIYTFEFERLNSCCWTRCSNLSVLIWFFEFESMIVWQERLFILVRTNQVYLLANCPIFSKLLIHCQNQNFLLFLVILIFPLRQSFLIKIRFLKLIRYIIISTWSIRRVMNGL